VTFVLALLIAFADLTAVKAEPDFNKKSELALANADHEVDVAHQAYSAADDKAFHAALDEIVESVDLSYDSLKQTHKAPRKSKYYKRAELKVQALLRRLASFRDEVSYEARPPVQAVFKKLSDLHDHLLADIMSKKK
jgi:hypothetical protein